MLLKLAKTVKILTKDKRPKYFISDNNPYFCQAYSKDRS